MPRADCQRYVSVAAAARRLNTSRAFLYRAIAQGRIPAVNLAAPGCRPMYRMDLDVLEKVFGIRPRAEQPDRRLSFAEIAARARGRS